MHPETPFRLAVLAIYLPMFIIRMRWHRRAQTLEPGVVNKEEGRWVAPLRWVFFPTCVFLVLAWLFEPDLMPWLILPLPDALRWVGLPLGMAGLVLLHLVHETLRENFSPRLRIRADHALITSGPYARVRHPMYTSFLLLVSGMALLSAHILIWLLFIGMTVTVIILRTPREEAMLRERFGSAWDAYKARTGMLLPRLGGG